MKNIFFLFTLTLCLVAKSASYIDYVSPYHPVVGDSGMVVSQNKLSSDIGIEILNKGGNAVDAAVAVGFSSGGYQVDEDCVRLKESKLLSDLGMKVAAVSRLCSSIDVFKAMLLAGSPCPIIQNSRLVVGKRAFLAMKTQPELYIPDYKNNTDWYNGVLQIGEVTEDVEEDIVSVSDKFRSTKQSAR